MKKAIVITSINLPTVAVRKYAKLCGYDVIVVGDLKTPKGWFLDNTHYLSPLAQKTMDYRLAKRLPWNSYVRKMLGYLYAIERGAEIIVDIDDDNIPLKKWQEPAMAGEFLTTEIDSGFVNIYSLFTNRFIWPRGFPLEKLLQPKSIPILKKDYCKIGVWQLLADGDTDVDAIYRLIINKKVRFKKRQPVVLSKGSWCPYNSQSTITSAEAFTLLYFPTFVPVRCCDIIRSYVAQPILWNHGFRVGFIPSMVVQERNPHNYIDDLKLEIPVLTSASDMASVTESVPRSANMNEDILAVYTELKHKKLIDPLEIGYLEDWLEDLKSARDKANKQ